MIQKTTYFPLILLRIVVALCAIFGFVDGVLAQANECVQKDVEDRFTAFHNKLDSADGDPQVALEVFQSVQAEIASIFTNPEPICPAECIFGSVGLAGRLPNSNLLTQQTSDSVYSFRTESVDTAGIALYLFAAGILEFSRGDRAAARIWFDSALTYPRPLHDGATYAAALKVRGFVNKYDKRYDEALSDFREASRVYSTYHNDLNAEIDILAASAEVHIERGDASGNALKSAEHAIRLFEENEEQFVDWKDSYNIYTSYARVLSARGYHKRADKAGARALELVGELNDQFRIAIVHTAIADQLIDAGRLKKARFHALAGYELFEDISKMSHMADALGQLIRIDRRQGAYKSALSFSELREEIKDSLTKTTQVHEIKRLQQNQAQNETLSKLDIAQTRERLLVAEKSEARMTLGFIISALGLVLLVVVVLIYRLWARKRTYAVLERLVARRTVELREHAKSLEEKNVELERFSFIASHDLKTPLRNITSFLNLANRRMSAETKSEIGEYLDIASSYARQMNHTICDVLEFSKVEGVTTSRSTRQQLRIVVDHAVKITRSEFEDKKPLVTVDGNVEVLCNKDYVEQIMLRLVHNALKFNASTIPMVSINISRSVGDFVEVVVKDNGIGIREIYAEKIFGLFERLNLQEQYPGTGLGLSFARKLARRMEGDIILKESSVGKGSTFILRLPLTPQAKPQKKSVELVGSTSEEVKNPY